MTHPCAGAFGDAFSEEEIEALLARLQAAYARKKGENPTGDNAAFWRAAIEETGKEAIRDNLIDRALRLHSRRARLARADLYGRIGLREDQALRAAMVGTERDVSGGAISIDARGVAREAKWQGALLRDLADAGLLSRFQRLVVDKEFDRAVMNEMARLTDPQRGRDTGNAEARLAAEIFAHYINEGRLAQNEVGAFIAPLPGYIVRQSHDPLKVAGGFWALGDAARAAARARWVDFIHKRLDPKTFDALYAERQRRRNLIRSEVTDRRAAMKRRVKNADEIDARRIAKIDPEGLAALDDEALEKAWLERIWADIVTGHHEHVQGAADDLDAVRAPPGTARTVSAHRVLHFKTADDFFDYNAEYGRGALFHAVQDQLRRAARNSALMEVFGPAPRAALEADIRRLSDRARARGDAAAVRGLKSPLRQAEFAQLDGSADAPESVRLAVITRNILAWQQLSKLGGMVLTGFSDIGLATTTLMRAGANMLDSYGAIIKALTALPGDQRTAVADHLNVGARVLAGDISARFGATSGFNGTMSAMLGVFYKANLFQFWTTRIRRAVGVMLARHLGQNAHLRFAALDAATAQTLKRYGIEAPLWDLLRTNVTDLEGDVGKVLTLDALNGLDGKAAARALGMKPARGGFTERQQREALREAEMRLTSYFTDQAETAMTEPRARERALIRGQFKPGTAIGTAISLFMQFKTFPTTIVTRQILPTAARARGPRKAIAPMAHLIASTLALGYVSMQAKMLAAGLKPRALRDENGKINGNVIMAAMLQGGGLGIYGDLLLADYNRFGQGLAETAGGPAIGDASAVIKMLSALARGAVTGEKQPRQAGRAAGLLKRNIPFGNLFYTKAALDYLLIFQLQEWASPGFMERYKRRLREERKSELLFEPNVR